MDNRRRILDCALALFSARGYDAVGVQEIVEAARVTKPTLYHYFNSKRGLLEALLEDQLDPFLRELQKASKYQPRNLPATLEEIARVYFRFAGQHPSFYRLQLTMQFASPDSEPNQAVARFVQAQRQMIEAMFLRAVEDHGNMRGRHQAYAATFIGMLDTYIGLFLNDSIDLNEELIYHSIHQFQHGIYS